MSIAYIVSDHEEHKGYLTSREIGRKGKILDRLGTKVSTGGIFDGHHILSGRDRASVIRDCLECSRGKDAFPLVPFPAAHG